VRSTVRSGSALRTARVALCALALLSAAIPAAAHVIDYELDPAPQGTVFLRYLKIGFEHIVPLGLDHILFILCVAFLNAHLKKIILQATMFTLAHSLTLALAASGVIEAPPFVEPLIAASIVFLAIENITTDTVKPWRLILVFLFGLVHGLGFAGALSELGIPRHAFVSALVAFNLGVEIGQLLIILAVYFLLARPFGDRPWFRRRIVIPVSAAIAAVALWWTVERIIAIT
jgi:hypothetical protein